MIGSVLFDEIYKSLVIEKKFRLIIVGDVL